MYVNVMNISFTHASAHSLVIEHRKLAATAIRFLRVSAIHTMALSTGSKTTIIITLANIMYFMHMMVKLLHSYMACWNYS